MSNLRGVILQKGKPGANAENLDGCCGLMNVGNFSFEGVELQANKTYMFRSLKEAEYYGITKDLDENYNVVLHRHISEFYRLAPKNTKLYFMHVSNAGNGEALSFAKQLVLEAKGEIRNVGVAYNTDETHINDFVDGLPIFVREDIAKAQNICAWAFEKDYPINIVLEGKNAQMNPSILDLRNIQVSGQVAEYGNVAVCVAQDYDYAETRQGASMLYADVGTLLGTIAKTKVNQNIGEIGEDSDLDNLNLSDVKKKIWVTAGFSNHTTIVENDDLLQTFENKGYIFAVDYIGATGYRWNNDHTCTPIIIDEDGNMNTHNLALARTLNKLARLVRVKLLPKVKSTVPVDTKTGLLPTGIVKYFDDLGSEALIEMQGRNEVSGGQVIVDPKSNLFGEKKELGVYYTMIPTGTIGQIKGVLNIKKSL